jgi:hypothetical protein
MNYKIVIKDVEGQYGISYLQRKILTEIIKIRNKISYETNGSFEYNILYISPRLSHIITDASFFSPVPAPEPKNYDEELIFIGHIQNMKVYIDINLNNNIVKISSDLSKIRNYKITSLFDNDKPVYTEAIIEIESDLI